MDDEELFTNAQSELDFELNELLIKNQKYLNEIQSDFKLVNKIAGEPTFKIRKVNHIDEQKLK